MTGCAKGFTEVDVDSHGRAMLSLVFGIVVEDLLGVVVKECLFVDV